MLDISYFSSVCEAKPSFVISDRDMSLFDTAFVELEQKTGVFIDPYGKTRIYPDHQRILMRALQGSQHVLVVNFVRFLSDSACQEEVLMADGD